MALNIKNESCENAARDLAARTGETISQAVETAVRMRLDTMRSEADIEARLKAITESLDAFGPVPEGLTREQIDEEMYDEWGLPR